MDKRSGHSNGSAFVSRADEHYWSNNEKLFASPPAAYEQQNSTKLHCWQSFTVYFIDKHIHCCLWLVNVIYLSKWFYVWFPFHEFYWPIDNSNRSELIATAFGCAGQSAFHTLFVVRLFAAVWRLLLWCERSETAAHNNNNHGALAWRQSPQTHHWPEIICADCGCE